MCAFDCNKSRWPWTSIYCSVVRVIHIVIKWLRLGSRSFNENVAQYRIALLAKFDYEIRRGPLDQGLKLVWGGFWLRNAISQKRCEIELRWQLITDTKSYMRFQLQYKLMTLNHLERQSTTLSSELCVFWLNGWG